MANSNTDTTMHGDMNPKSVSVDIALDIATLLIGHLDGYLLREKNPFKHVDGYSAEHTGSIPIRIDYYQGEIAEKIVGLRRIHEKTMGGAVVYHEEAVQKSFIAGSDDRRYKVVLDPLDGSTIYSASGTGCVSVLVYYYSSKVKQWQLQAGCVAINNGYAFTYRLLQRRNISGNTVDAEVTVSRFNNRPLRADEFEPVEIISPDIDIESRNSEGRPNYVLASTAGSPSRRDRMQLVLTERAGNIKFLGSFAGNLSIWGAVMGQVSVIADPQPSTMHDGNYLLILQALGWQVLDLDTKEEVQLLALAEQNCDPAIAQEKRIPPVIAFRNDQVRQEWLDAQS